MNPGELIRIVVDDRERNASLLDCLRKQLNVVVEIKRLPLGDYLLPNLLVERKSLFDFCQSIKDGRFFTQIGKLANSKVQPLIILEIAQGTSEQSRISIKARQGALISASILYSIPVIRSRSAEETVQIMLTAHAQIKGLALK